MTTTQKSTPERISVQKAVHKMLAAAETCRDLLGCRRLEGENTCLHRLNKNAKETLCRTCRLVRALDDLEDAPRERGACCSRPPTPPLTTLRA